MVKPLITAFAVPFFLLFAASGIIAQESASLDGTKALVSLPSYDEELSATFFAQNRERLRDTLPDSSVVALFSAPIKARTNDINYPYHQDPDFYYFTGIKKENAMLLLFKQPIRLEGKWYREILFIEDKDVKKEMWTGTMLSAEEASEISGVGAVWSNTAFKPLQLDWDQIQHVFANRHLFIEGDDLTHPGDLMSLINHFYKKCERAERPVLVDEGEDLFAYLRQKKSPEELKMIQRAVDITCEAHNNVMRSIKPGMTENQLQAIIEYTFRYNGADGPAFPSIVANGDNGSIMHYTDNSSLLIPGDMVIMDIGAQYEQYAADITRTIPVNGVFSEEQRQVYQLVLDAHTVAIRYARPGYKFWTPHEEAYRTIGKGLIKLGIIKEWAEIADYFMHGTSHYLGLDVHDAGVYSALKPGDVLTVEPGIYIPEGSPCDEKWWGIFVRIEDDILITEDAAQILSDTAPRTIADIEAMMQRAGSSQAEQP
jgi:Xaa-Pro aminopeptidase